MLLFACILPVSQVASMLRIEHLARDLSPNNKPVTSVVVALRTKWNIITSTAQIHILYLEFPSLGRAQVHHVVTHMQWLEAFAAQFFLDYCPC